MCGFLYLACVLHSAQQGAVLDDEKAALSLCSGAALRRWLSDAIAGSSEVLAWG